MNIKAYNLATTMRYPYQQCLKALLPILQDL
jgi:hypothetical protein